MRRGFSSGTVAYRSRWDRPLLCSRFALLKSSICFLFGISALPVYGPANTYRDTCTWPARNKDTCTCPALWLLARFIALDLMAGSFTFAHSPQWRRSATGDGQPSSPAPSSPLECLILGMIYSTVHIYL
jgi:hypothetical protein